MTNKVETMIVYKVILSIFIAHIIQCNKTSKIITNFGKKSLPNFRKQVEEIPLEKSIEIEDPNQNLVSFLVKNVKQIFTDSEQPTILLEPDLNSVNTETSTIDLKSTLVSTVTENDTIATDVNETQKADYNGTIRSIHPKKLIYVKSMSNNIKKEDLSRTKFNSSDVFIHKSQHEINDTHAFNSKSSTILNMSLQEQDNSVLRRSCIACNNVVSMECNNPKNKLIPSTICSSEEDLCYSQHTPFGIVNRGCFNIYNNLTTYVCSCNLCNYISISEMPHIFSTKRDWIENVIELARTKSFKKSIFKDMSCLTCEVNATMTKSLINNTNCLEGNIRTLPIQECAENEICGVKSIRSDGYIWRGCLTSPLYNYWWTLCDSDLCNYDSLVSIYDELL